MPLRSTPLSAARRVAQLHKAAFFALGFAIAFNPILVLIGPLGVRLTDVIVPVVCLYLRLADREAQRGSALRLSSLVLFLVAAAPSAYFCLTAFDGGTAAFLARIYLYGGSLLLAGPALWKTTETSRRLSWGVLAGLVCAVAALLMDRYLPAQFAAIGFAFDPDTIVSQIRDTRRATAFWGHANEAMAVVAMCACLVLGGAPFGKRLPISVLVLGLVAAAALCTQTRSGALIVGLVCVAQAFRRGPAFTLMCGVAAAIALPALFMWAPDVVAAIERRLSVGLQENLLGRIESTLFVAEYAVMHPFGSTISSMLAPLDASYNLGSSHNSFLFIAGVLGFAASVIAVGRMIGVALGRRRYGGDLAVLALALSLQFLFEEVIIDASILFLFFYCLHAKALKRPAQGMPRAMQPGGRPLPPVRRTS